VLGGRFGDDVLRLPRRGRCALLKTIADAGVFGGASYDGLVALEAHAHGRVLLSLDRRAQETYRRLRRGVPGDLTSGQPKNSTSTSSAR